MAGYGSDLDVGDDRTGGGVGGVKGRNQEGVLVSSAKQCIIYWPTPHWIAINHPEECDKYNDLNCSWLATRPAARAYVQCLMSTAMSSGHTWNNQIAHNNYDRLAVQKPLLLKEVTSFSHKWRVPRAGHDHARLCDYHSPHGAFGPLE